MLERKRVTLASLHLGIDCLTERGSHALRFRIGTIFDHTPQVAPHALLYGAIDAVMDIGLRNAIA
jgi:hypothetical protein